MANSQVAEFMQILSGYSIVELSKMLRRSQVELADLFVRYDGNVEKIAKAKGVASNTIPKQLNRLKNALEPKKPELTPLQFDMLKEFAESLDKKEYQIDEILNIKYKCRNGYYSGFIAYSSSNKRLKVKMQRFKCKFDINDKGFKLLSGIEREKGKGAKVSDIKGLSEAVKNLAPNKPGLYRIKLSDLPEDVRKEFLKKIK